MALTKQKKSELLHNFTDMVKNANSLVFVHAKGLSVADTTNLRNALHKTDSGYKVTKKTLLARALVDAQITGTMPVLEGEIAVAYSKDLTAPAREVYEFAKKFKEQIALVGGVFENRFMDAQEILSIAMIPATPVLRGMFVNIINSPIQRFAIALNAIAEKKV